MFLKTGFSNDLVVVRCDHFKWFPWIQDGLKSVVMPPNAALTVRRPLKDTARLM